MKLFYILPAALMTLLTPAVSANSADQTELSSYTIYLVRHAEKEQAQQNPALTQCGQQRAQQLASMLAQADIKQIYSTDYQRTQQTAAPLAKKLALNINSYSPRELTNFAQQLKAQGVNTLVVGHSNTTPQLTAAIAQQTVNPISEKEYQMLYQVVVTGEHSQLNIIKQPLTCQ